MGLEEVSSTLLFVLCVWNTLKVYTLVFPQG